MEQTLQSLDFAILILGIPAMVLSLGLIVWTFVKKKRLIDEFFEDKYLDDVQKDVYVTWLGEDDESESAEESDGEEEDDFEEDSSDDEVTHLDLSDALDFWADQWLKRGGQTVTLDEAVEALSVFLDEHGYETTIKKIALGSFFKRHGYHRGRKRVDGKMVTHVFLPKLKKGS